MNIEMEKMLKQMGVSYGEKANCLVKAKVLTCDYIVKKAIESKDPDIMYHTALCLEGITAENIEKLAKAIIETKDEEYIYKFRELPDVPNNFDNIIERGQLEEISDEDKMKNLLDLIHYKNIDSIEYNADIYRRLFVDNEQEAKEIEEEIKHKKKVLKPQIPIERKLTK